MAFAITRMLNATKRTHEIFVNYWKMLIGKARLVISIQISCMTTGFVIWVPTLSTCYFTRSSHEEFEMVSKSIWLSLVLLISHFVSNQVIVQIVIVIKYKRLLGYVQLFHHLFKLFGDQKLSYLTFLLGFRVHYFFNIMCLVRVRLCHFLYIIFLLFFGDRVRFTKFYELLLQSNA